MVRLVSLHRAASLGRVDLSRRELLGVSLTYENADYADGPKLAAWLETRVKVSLYPDTVGRAICRWRTGVAAEFWTVDRVLVAVGFMPADLPDEVWCDPPRKVRTRPPKRRAGIGGKKLTPAQVLEIRREARCGVKKRVLAERFGVCPRTIANCANGWTYQSVKRAAA